MINILVIDYYYKINNCMALWSTGYSFHPISAKVYKEIGYHGGIQAITFLGNRPSFKNFVAL